MLWSLFNKLQQISYEFSIWKKVFKIYGQIQRVQETFWIGLQIQRFFMILFFLNQNLIIFIDYELTMKLRSVKIYFDATTFDQITKDRAAKFVDMISAIGGTLGLFTGFSLISAVEIVYFGIKLLYKALKSRCNNDITVQKMLYVWIFN